MFGWASSDLAELLVSGPSMTMYVLFDVFLSYQMGVIYGSLWGVLPSNPYITPVTPVTPVTPEMSLVYLYSTLGPKLVSAIIDIIN